MPAVRNGPSEPKGITLVDFPIDVAILGILSAVAIPGILGSIYGMGVNGASQRVTEDIRLARSSAVMGGGQTRLIVLDQSGTVPDPDNFHDPTRANKYGIELRTGPSASWLSLNDHRSINSHVVTVWQNLENQYRGVSVITASDLVFNSQGRPMNCSAPGYTIWQGLGPTKTAQPTAIGKATVL